MNVYPRDADYEDKEAGKAEEKGTREGVAKAPLDRRSSSRRLGPLAFATKVPVFI